MLLCGHGSRDPQAIQEFGVLTQRLRSRLPQFNVGYGFLEFAEPDLVAGLDELCRRGESRILAIPTLLFAAGHVLRDIPAILERYQTAHPEIAIRYGRELGVDERMIQAAEDRIRQALGFPAVDVPLCDTLLLVVGRGASDADVNGNVIKIMRSLWERLGVGWGEACFAGNAIPLVEPALEHAVRLGYRRIVVFPHFLFTGVLVRRIYEAADAIAARCPQVEVLKAPYLFDHPLVVETLAERIVADSSAGGARPNQLTVDF